jgi:hypothetical protein
MSTNDVTRAQRIAGRAIAVLVVGILVIASAFPKLVGTEYAVESFERFGYADGITLMIGVIELSVAILYAIPITSVLGAVVMAGFLGGAAATQVRIGDPWFLLPIVIAILAWLSLYLREPRLRALLLLRSSTLRNTFD